ncbi:uncharacterized protein DS421_18g605100 [Arachis hypogaea]|nr:uncharacterized protein DS421_18g605100 [Arachis hypogaea]
MNIVHIIYIPYNLYISDQIFLSIFNWSCVFCGYFSLCFLKYTLLIIDRHFSRQTPGVCI